jgi:hypothetical protein
MLRLGLAGGGRRSGARGDVVREILCVERIGDVACSFWVSGCIFCLYVGGPGRHVSVSGGGYRGFRPPGDAHHFPFNIAERLFLNTRRTAWYKLASAPIKYIGCSIVLAKGIN